MPFISVGTGTFPYLQLDGMTTAAAWGAGKLYRIGLVSRFIRITPRGLQYAVQQGGPDIFVRPRGGWWKKAQCALVAGGLCEQTGRDGASMVLFSSGTVDVPDQIRDIPGFASIGYLSEIEKRNLTCTNANANREIVLRDSRYELSLCDLMDNELDLVVDWTTEELFWRVGGASTAFYAFVACFGIYLVAQLASNVKRILEPCVKGEEEETKEEWVVAYVLVVLATVAFLAVNFTGTLELLLTADDVTMFWVLNTFVALHTLLFLRDEWSFFAENRADGECEKLHRSVRGVSFLTSILLALTVHVHLSFANPYAWLLVTLFGVRSVHKMLKAVSGYKRVPLPQRVLHVWDFFVLLCLLTLVVAADCESEVVASVRVFQTVFFCLAAGFLLSLKTVQTE